MSVTTRAAANRLAEEAVLLLASPEAEPGRPWRETAVCLRGCALLDADECARWADAWSALTGTSAQRGAPVS